MGLGFGVRSREWTGRSSGAPPPKGPPHGPRQTGLEVISIFLKVNSPRFVGELTQKVNSRPESETIILLIVYCKIIEGRIWVLVHSRVGYPVRGDAVESDRKEVLGRS